MVNYFLYMDKVQYYFNHTYHLRNIGIETE